MPAACALRRARAEPNRRGRVRRARRCEGAAWSARRSVALRRRVRARAPRSPLLQRQAIALLPLVEPAVALVYRHAHAALLQRERESETADAAANDRDIVDAGDGDAARRLAARSHHEPPGPCRRTQTAHLDGGGAGARGGESAGARRGAARDRARRPSTRGSSAARSASTSAAERSKPGGKYGATVASVAARGARRELAARRALVVAARRAHGCPHAALAKPVRKRSTASRLGRRSGTPAALAAMAAERASPPPMSLYGIRLTRTPRASRGARGAHALQRAEERGDCVGVGVAVVDAGDQHDLDHRAAARRRQREQRRDEAVAERLGRVPRRRHERAPHGRVGRVQRPRDRRRRDASSASSVSARAARNAIGIGATVRDEQLRAPKAEASRVRERARVARRTARALSAGSPMPMKTRFASERARRHARAARAAPRRPARKSRRSRGAVAGPCDRSRQNAQPIAQPTCDDTHSVVRARVFAARRARSGRRRAAE